MKKNFFDENFIKKKINIKLIYYLYRLLAILLEVEQYLYYLFQQQYSMESYENQ